MSYPSLGGGQVVWNKALDSLNQTKTHLYQSVFSLHGNICEAWFGSFLMRYYMYVRI